jgi:two-component system, cell cycle response regulator
MRIALVDPDAAAQALTARVLEARSHDVLCFADGARALEQVRTDAAIDALITDVEAPPTSGMELCWETRLLASKTRSIYILLMASPDDKRTWVEALDCGADDTISRAPVPEELYAKLRSAERVITLQRDLIRLATRDPLTGAYNRRAFFEQATDACQEASREHPLSVILLDIDRFKAINDHYGHGVGDEALRAVVKEAQDGSVVGRLGGDEFVVLLKGTALSEAVERAEDLRRRLAQLRVPSDEGAVHLTCSLGTGEHEPEDTIDDLMKRADLALYRAKEEGRDRVGTPPEGSWLSQRPRQAVSLVRSIARQPHAPRPRRERREGAPPSDALLARISAVVDLLVDSGLSEEGAARLMIDRMVSVGVRFPTTGSARWKDLLAWRSDLQNGAAWEDVVREYQEFAALIKAIPPHERVDRVVQEELWDRRRVRPGARS